MDKVAKQQQSRISRQKLVSWQKTARTPSLAVGAVIVSGACFLRPTINEGTSAARPRGLIQSLIAL